MSDRTGADCMLLYHQEGDEQHLKAAQRIHFLEQRIAELQARLDAVAKLPEKWCSRIQVLRAYKDLETGAVFHFEMTPRHCAEELKAALGGDDETRR